MNPTRPASRKSFIDRRFRRAITATIVLAFAAASDPVRAEEKHAPHKEFRPGRPWLDTGGTHINAHGHCIIDHDGRHYWYGAHKIEGKTENEKNEAGVRCYVSDDLLNWKDEGLVLDVFAKDAHPELAKAFILDRPKVVHHVKSGKFILYFKLYPPKEEGGKSGKDYAYVGVATSVNPTGPFEYKGRFLGAGTEFGTGDFAMYADEDGSIYHICVRKPDKFLIAGKMTDDGLRPAGEYFEMRGVIRATEAPALFRRGSKVYLLGSGSTGWKPNPARMFVADQLAGPWKDLGNPCKGINPHNKLGPEKTFGGQSTFV
ncbi:MAG: family 43 glycosylhydrolase [Verrucomicrobiales bacterium]